MTSEHVRGTPSKAAIAKHPIHPMLVPFPIAFLVGALVSDIAFWATGDPFWARVSLWLVGAGLVMGALAAVFGLIDFLMIRRVRSYAAAWAHFVGNAVALLLALASLLLRMDDAAEAVLPGGIVLSALTVLILIVTGWLGGELAYRYRIGMIDEAGAEHRGTPAAGEPYAGSHAPR